MKVNCLLQSSFGCIPPQDFTLQQDIVKIFRLKIKPAKFKKITLSSGIYIIYIYFV